MVWIGVSLCLAACLHGLAQTGATAKARQGWPQFRGNPQLTGVSGAELPDELALRWKARLPDAVESTAAIVDGWVYVGCNDGGLYALNLDDGKEKWKHKTESPVRSSPTVAHGVVYSGNDEGVMHALEATTGKVKWTFKTGGEIFSSVNVHDQRLYFGSYDENLYCLGIDGKLAWKHPTAGRVHGTPALIEGHVLVAGCDEFLHVVRANDGMAVRSVDLGSMSGASAAVDGARVVVGTFGNQVVAVDWKTGRRLWSFEDPERPFPFLSSAAITTEFAVIGGRDKRVRAFDPSDGKVRWSFSTRGKVDGSPVICGPRVFFASEDGVLYAIDLRKGTQSWRYESGSAFAASPALASDLLVIGTLDGDVLCFGSKQ